jgi:hypothetical protein
VIYKNSRIILNKIKDIIYRRTEENESSSNIIRDNSLTADELKANMIQQNLEDELRAEEEDIISRFKIQRQINDSLNYISSSKNEKTCTRTRKLNVHGILLAQSESHIVDRIKTIEMTYILVVRPFLRYFRQHVLAETLYPFKRPPNSDQYLQLASALL